MNDPGNLAAQPAARAERPRPDGRVHAHLGLLALVIGTGLNMLRMAPIFLSDGFERTLLPPKGAVDIAAVALLDGWYLSHVMAVVSVPFLIYGFVAVYQLVSSRATDAVGERTVLAGVFGLATGLALYLVAAVLDGVAVPRAAEHFLAAGDLDRAATSAVMTGLHETAASFGGHFMAAAMISTGLLAVGLVRLGHRTLHSLTGALLGAVGLVGSVTGVLDLSFQERFPLLGALVGVMMIWWVALAIALRNHTAE